MRTIKLKGWNPIVSRMSEPMTLREIYDTKGVQWHIIMWLEFTGLKDKNGKEIYEGDIVVKKEEDFSETENWEDTDARWIDKEYKLPLKEVNRDYVTLENFGFWLKNESFGYEGEDLQTSEYYEIIGNIYENPELLSTPTAVL